MKSFFIFLMLCDMLTAYPQTKVILDADIDSDVDDVAALAMLNRLHNKKTVELIGVIVTSDDPYAVVCAAAINQYFGNKDIPLGFKKDQPALKNHSRYTKQVSETFPHPLNTFNDAEDATTLYRRLLSKEKNNAVVIVTIGHLSSLQALLKSGADTISSQPGKELALKKISRWICMGGMFPSGKEANFYRPDPLSTAYCLENWTRPVVFCGWEIGNQIISGGEYLRNALTKDNPVYLAFERYNQFAGRPSWDQVAVLLLITEWKKYFDLVSSGLCVAAPDGSNVWKEGKQSNHAYVTLKKTIDAKSIALLIDNIIINNQR